MGRCCPKQSSYKNAISQLNCPHPRHSKNRLTAPHLKPLVNQSLQFRSIDCEKTYKIKDMINIQTEN